MIAETLGYGLNHVFLLKRSPLFRQKVEEITRELEERMMNRAVDLHAAIDALAPEALSTIEEVMKNKDESGAARLRSAQVILDRCEKAPIRRRFLKAEQDQESKIVQIPAVQIINTLVAPLRMGMVTK